MRRIFILFIFAVACSSAPAAVSTAAPVPSPSASATTLATKSAPSSTIASGTVTVELAEHFFSPSLITVRVGTTVVWRDVGQQTHDVHARDGSFNSPLMGPGDTYRYTFAKVGKYPYYCAPHEGDGMTGEVDVLD